jgi:FecR protein
MSRPPLDSEPGELLRQLAQEPVPNVPEDASPARRDLLVRSMKDAVERAAESAERGRRFRRGGVLVAAAAGIVLLSGLLLKEHRALEGSGAIAGLDRVSGTVVLTQEGTGRVVGSGERALRDGDSLQTATGAHAHLATHKSSVNVSESTELKVSRPSAAEERISLRRGRVDVEVDKAVETKRSVVVETPDAEVVVRGTVFDVRVEPLLNATNTRVHVTRGSVWVLAQGVQVALLSAGQSWSSAGGIEAAAPPQPALVDPGTSGTPQVDNPAPVTPPAVARVGTAPAPAKETSPHKAGTLAEENRLFSAGVEARNRGDGARAAELFGELLSSYPQSTLREVAQVERFRALKQAGQTTRAAGEARRYLAEHADGAARSEARDLALSDK